MLPMDTLRLLLMCCVFVNVLTKHSDYYMKTTHKPIFGDPPPVKDLYQGYYDEHNYDYNLGKLGEYSFLGKEDNLVYSENSIKEKTQSKQGQNEKYGENQQTFKEGSDDPDMDIHYGFVGEREDMKSEHGGYIVSKQKAGLPFSQDSKHGQILDDAAYGINPESFQSNYYNAETFAMVKKCESEENAKYYCIKLRDGRYFDPWNPWCGFIQCVKGEATRICCNKGSWMGLSHVIRFTIKEMCRRRLPRGVKIGEDDVCPEITDYELCKNAERVQNHSAK